ncbi:MAG: four helix bundle protein [Kiritimatiellia bacterium]
MAKSDFENLEVYRLAEELADEVWKIVIRWDAFAKQTMGRQLVDAADSIGANIADGRGRRDTADNRRFVRIAWGSLNETQHFLRRAYRRQLLNAEQIRMLRTFLDPLPPKLNAYHQALKPRSARSSVCTPS